MPPPEPMDLEYTAERQRKEAAWMAELHRDGALYEAANGPQLPLPVPAPPDLGAPTAPTRPPPAPGTPTAMLRARLAQKAQDFGIDPQLALAVASTESAWDPKAESPKGASGLMQLMPATARRFGVTDIWDTEQNMTGGLKYLKHLSGLFPGRTDLQLAAYNAGEGAVAQYKGIPPYKETQAYVQKIMGKLSPIDADVAADAAGMMRTAGQRGASGSWQSGASGTWAPPVPPPKPKPAQISAATGPRPPGLAFVDQGMPGPPGPGLREAGGVARGVLNVASSLFSVPSNLVEVLAPPEAQRTEGRIATEMLTAPLTNLFQDLSLLAKQASTAIDFPERQKDFRDKLAEGLGSMAAYWAPAIISGGITGVGQATARGLARWSLSGPAVAATIMESFDQANGVYTKMRPIVGVNEAAARAGKSLAANVVLIGLTNAAGLGNRVKDPLLKIMASALAEGPLQEGVQYAEENQHFWVPADHPSAALLKAQGWKEGSGRVFKPFSFTDAAEVSLVGMVLGGGVAVLDTGVVTQASAPVLRNILDTLTPNDASAVLPQVSGWGAFRLAGEAERGGIPLPDGQAPARERTLNERIADYDDLIAVGDTLGEPTDQLVAQRDTLLQALLDTETPAPLPPAPDDMPQQPSPPTLRPRTSRAPTFGEGATGLTPDTFRDAYGRWRIPLRDMPPEELELQDFIRQQGGIRLNTETDMSGELRDLITTKETGLYRLQNNTSGKSLQMMAEAAAEAGFPASADKREFRDLMDRSIRQNQPVYSLNASGQVPLLDDPFMADAYRELLDIAQTLEARTVVQRRAEDGPRRRADVLTTAQEAVTRGEYTVQDVRDLLPGMSLNDEESAKMMVVMGTLSDNLMDKFRAILEAGPEQQDLQAERAMAQALTLVGELDPQRMGVLAEAGRSLGILNDPLSAYNQRLKALHGALNRVEGMTPYHLAQKMVAFDNDRPTMLRIAKDLETAAEKETFLEQWVNGILEANLPDRDLLGDPLFAQAMAALPLELTTEQRDRITPLLLESAQVGIMPGLTPAEQASVAEVPQTAEGLRTALGDERFAGLVDEFLMQSTPLQASSWAPTLLEHFTLAQLDDVGRPLLATMRPGQITDLQARRPDIIRTLANVQSQGDLFAPGETRPLTLLDWMSIPQLEALGTETLESMLPPGIREVELNNPQFQRLTRALGLMNAVRVLERRALQEMGGKLWTSFTPEQQGQVGPWILRVLPDDEAATHGEDVVAALGRRGQPQPGAEDLGALRLRLLEAAGPERWHRIAGDMLRIMTTAQLREFGPRIVGTMSSQDIEHTPFYIFAAMDPESFPMFLEKLYPQSVLNRDMPPVADTLHLDTLGADIQATLSPRQTALLRASTQELLTRGDLTPAELGSLAPDVLRLLGTSQVKALGRRLILTMNAFQVETLHGSIVRQFAQPDTPLPGMGIREAAGPGELRTVDEVEAEPQAALPGLERLPERDVRQEELPGAEAPSLLPEAFADDAQMLDEWNTGNTPLLPGPPRQPFRTHVGSIVLEQWIQGLLGSVTAVVNAASAVIVPVYRVVEEGMTGIVSQYGGSAEGHPRVVLAQLRALGSGIAEGWELAGRAVRTSEEQFERAYHLKPTGSAPMAEISRKPATSAENFGLDPESLIGKAFDWWATWIGLANGGRTIFRAMLGADEFAKAVNFRMELAALADIDAYQKGMDTQQAHAHQEWALRHPAADAMRQAAAQQTILNVFQQEITPDRPIAKIVGAFAGIEVNIMGVDLPLGRAIVPFPRASTNIPAFALERTPLGLAMTHVRDDIAAGGIRADRAIAKHTLGLLTSVALAKLAFEGLITGRGPEDYEQRRALEATGWRPYAVKLFGFYWPLNRFDPFSTQLGLVSDLVQVLRDDEMPEGAYRVGAAIVYSLSQNLASRTYMESMARFFSAISPRHMSSPAGVLKGAEEWGRGMVSSLIPWPLSTAQRINDPYARENRDLTNYTQHLLGRLYARLPGWAAKGSAALPLDRNRWAEPRLLGWGHGPKWLQALGSAFSPIVPSMISDSPIDQELARQRITLAPSSPVLNVRAPTDDASQEAAFQQDPTTSTLLRLTPQQQELREIYQAANMAELRKLPGSHRLYDPEELTKLTGAVVSRLNNDNDALGLRNAVLPEGVTDLKGVLNWAIQQPQYQVLQSYVGPRGAKQGFLQYVDQLYKDYGERQFLLDQPELAHRVQTAKDYSQYWRTPAVRQPEMREQQENQRLRVGQ